MPKKFTKLLWSLAITINAVGCSNVVQPVNSAKAYYSSDLGDYAYCNAESCPQATRFTLDEEEEQKPIFIEPIVVADSLVERVDVHYDFSKSVLRKSEIRKLEEQFHKLKNENVKVTIIGYTDNVEASNRNSRFNQKLALSRAKVVKNFIVRHFGVKASDITISGKPLCCYVTSNKTAKGRAENRRAEVQVYVHH